MIELDILRGHVGLFFKVDIWIILRYKSNLNLWSLYSAIMRRPDMEVLKF